MFFGGWLGVSDTWVASTTQIPDLPSVYICVFIYVCYNNVSRLRLCILILSVSN